MEDFQILNVRCQSERNPTMTADDAPVLPVTIMKAHDQISVRAVNAVVRYDGIGKDGSDKFDIVINRSARAALALLERYADHRLVAEGVRPYYQSGTLRSKDGSVAAFEFGSCDNEILILTVHCDNLRKEPAELRAYMEQALQAAQDYAERVINSEHR